MGRIDGKCMQRLTKIYSRAGHRSTIHAHTRFPLETARTYDYGSRHVRNRIFQYSTVNKNKLSLFHASRGGLGKTARKRRLDPTGLRNSIYYESSQLEWPDSSAYAKMFVTGVYLKWQNGKKKKRTQRCIGIRRMPVVTFYLSVI